MATACAQWSLRPIRWWCDDGTVTTQGLCTTLMVVRSRSLDTIAICTSIVTIDNDIFFSCTVMWLRPSSSTSRCYYRCCRHCYCSVTITTPQPPLLLLLPPPPPPPPLPPTPAPTPTPTHTPTPTPTPTPIAVLLVIGSASITTRHHHTLHLCH